MIVVLTFCLLVALSIAAHEFGHVLVGKHYGWERVGGIKFKNMAFGVGLGHKDAKRGTETAGKVVIAGSCATLLMTALFIGLSYLSDWHSLFSSLAALNFALFVYNLLPLPITDGGKILELITGWRAKWRYMAIAWVGMELAIFAIVVLVQDLL